MMKEWVRAGSLLLVCTLTAVAHAQQTPESGTEQPRDRAEREGRFQAPRLLGWGIRAGVADDPDQVVGGFHLDMGGVMDRVRAEPKFEIGFGEDHTTLTATAALHYIIDNNGPARPFVGAGIGAGLDYFDPPDRGSDTDLKLHLSLIGGSSWVLQSRKEFFLEGSLILGAIHDLQLMAGWRF